MIIGSGPNRIGQGIEFDYCCVHAAQSFRALGYEAVMVNCNPETVSTDYDTSDRLYFEPLGVEEVLAVCEREQPEGVVIQFGGQTPLKLARALEAAGFRILGHAVRRGRPRRGPRAVRRAARRASGSAARRGGSPRAGREAAEIAHRIGYPVLVRPSYVLGGRAMRVCYRGAEVVEAFRADLRGRVLVDRFVENAIEIDVDALCDGTDTYVAAVMQHVEEAGVHSGDSACVLPAPSLTATTAREIEDVVPQARARARHRRADQRPARRRRGRRRLRARGEPARVADGAVRLEGDRAQPRRGRVPARRRGDDHASSRSRPSARLPR